MKFTLDHKKIPNGTILVFHIRYTLQAEPDSESTRGRTLPTVYTYAMLKAGGLWYVTGSGKVPVAAGWGAVERWLDREGREVVKVEVSTGMTTIWPVDTSQS